MYGLSRGKAISIFLLDLSVTSPLQLVPGFYTELSADVRKLDTNEIKSNMVLKTVAYRMTVMGILLSY